MSVLERANRTPEILRNKRKRLFKAFDIYKQNVAYGLEQESQETHKRIATWYQNCLELNYDAINNFPQEIQKYL